jgi:mannose-6-phosphate isomerase-like protein (cupin superfamily)
MSYTTREILIEYAASYNESVRASESFAVEVCVMPTAQSWCVKVVTGQGVQISEVLAADPAMRILMSAETLEAIYNGEMTALTAGAKGSGSDSAPLEIEFLEASRDLEDARGVLIGFLQRFFVRQRPERILLGQEHSRVIHGAHAIPLYYGTGFRSAWYKLKPGQCLNEPGDTDPFSQAIIIIFGRGLAKIGDDNIEVRAGESYYIPPGSDHVVKTADQCALELIWLAWGEGA